MIPLLSVAEPSVFLSDMKSNIYGIVHVYAFHPFCHNIFLTSICEKKQWKSYKVFLKRTQTFVRYSAIMHISSLNNLTIASVYLKIKCNDVP